MTTYKNRSYPELANIYKNNNQIVNYDTMTNTSVEENDSIQSLFQNDNNDSQMIWIWIVCGIITLFLFITFSCWYYCYNLTIYTFDALSVCANNIKYDYGDIII